MFLTRGEIHQEPLWALWFQHLAGLVPVSALRVSQHATTTAMPGLSMCAWSPWLMTAIWSSLCESLLGMITNTITSV